MNQIDPAVCEELHPACLRLELRPKVAQTEENASWQVQTCSPPF